MSNILKLKSALNLAANSNRTRAENIVRGTSTREVKKLEDHKVTPDSLKPWDASGYFLKEGNHRVDGQKTWHRRFVILSKGAIYWYETDKSQEFLGSMAINSTVEVHKDVRTEKHCLVIVSGRRELVISPIFVDHAERDQILAYWLEDINSVIKPTTGDQSNRTRSTTGLIAPTTSSLSAGERPSQLSCLLITSNVGDLFESPNNQLVIDSWTLLMQQLIRKHDPHFVVFTLQEIGGKDSAFLGPLPYFYETFAEQILETGAEPYHHSGLIWNPDLKSADFQAMASMFMAKRSISNLVSFWDYRVGKYVPFTEMNPLQEFAHTDAALNGQIQNRRFLNTKSRKGFIETKWRLGNQEVKIVNVHLYHDDSNTVAIEKAPSVYAEKRQQAFLEMLERCDVKDNEATFIAGDYNFRMDCADWIKWMRDEYKQQLLSDVNFLVIKEKKIVFKELAKFFNDRSRWPKLLEFDREPSRVNNSQNRVKLLEQPIDFPPTYCLDEDDAIGKAPPGTSHSATVLYDDKRIPSWCDRIMYTAAAKSMIDSNSKYQVVLGQTGDHIPVYLTFNVKNV